MRTTIIRGAAALTLLLGATGCGFITTGGSAGSEEQDQGSTGQEQDEGGGAPDEGGGASDGSAASDGGGADPDDGAGTAGDPVEASDVEVTDLGETIAESSFEHEGTTVTFELKGVVADQSSMTVHGVLTNSGRSDTSRSLPLSNIRLIPDGVTVVGSSHQINNITVTDSSTGNVHTPAYTADGACLCTLQEGALSPGESLTLFAQYAPLPEGTTSVTVSFGPLGSFSNVPVTWS